MTDERKAELRRRICEAEVGAWAFMCCEQDLYEIETSAEAEDIRAQLREALEGDDEDDCMLPSVYRTKLAALRIIRASIAPGDTATLADLDAMIAREGA